MAISRVQEDAHRAGTTLSGRRVYHEVLHHLLVANGQGLHMALADLGSIACTGQTTEDLSRFAHLIYRYASAAEDQGAPALSLYSTVREAVAKVECFR